MSAATVSKLRPPQRNAFPTIETEDILLARLAMTGDSSLPFTKVMRCQRTMTPDAVSRRASQSTP
jgi:hypothetical protein